MATLNTVHKGSVAFSGSDTSKTDSWSGTKDNAILFISFSQLGASPSQVCIRGEITNDTTLTFTRSSSGTSVTVYWHVVEFSSGVDVQHGTFTTSINHGVLGGMQASITEVNPRQSFVVSSWSKGGSAFGSDDFAATKLVSRDRIGAAIYDSSTDMVVAYQVVEYDACKVHQWKAPNIFTTTSESGSWSGKEANSMILGGFTAAIPDTTNLNEYMPTSKIDSDSSFTSRRNSSGDVIFAFPQIVEFTDGTTVQRGTASFGTGDTVQSPTISAVDDGKSLPILGGHMQCSGLTSYTASDIAWGPCGFELDIPPLGTSLSITRVNALSSTAEADWQVVEWL